MGERHVSLQVNVGSYIASDWMRRDVPEVASSSQDVRGIGTGLRPRHELSVRLHGLRGTIEAIADPVFGPSVSVTLSQRAHVTHATPRAYRGMRFLLLSDSY